MSLLRRSLLRLLGVPGVASILAPAMRGRAVIFMLHRFADPDRGVRGHDPDEVREALGYLRRHRYELLDLVELFRRLSGQGPAVQRAVAFTIDDGYSEQTSVAAAVFAEFDCPVTIFVTTGFVDGRLWLWWDQVEHVIGHTRRPTLHVTIDQASLTYDCQAPLGRELARQDFVRRCVEVSDDEKNAAIARLADVTEVEIPAAPPAGYAPTTWAELRACEARGMSVGAQTVTHPILARAPDDRSQWEIHESWRRVCAEVQRPVSIFCYPNGRNQDFGEREINTLRRLGFSGAVGGFGYAAAASVSGRGDGAFRVARFGYPDSFPYFLQYVTGFEWVKQRVRLAARS